MIYNASIDLPVRVSDPPVPDPTFEIKMDPELKFKKKRIQVRPSRKTGMRTGPNLTYHALTYLLRVDKGIVPDPAFGIQKKSGSG